MKIILFSNPFRDKGLKVTLGAREILGGFGMETEICVPYTEGGELPPDLPRDIELSNLNDTLDSAGALICFGGDGTILHAAKYAYPYNLPILGVNMGSVGFMAELEHTELRLLEKLAAGTFTIEPRMMLDVRVKRGSKTLLSDTALNDAVISKGAVAQVLDLAVAGDEMLITCFAGDGVIVATPTGSTGYSMSAGGPIVEPDSENLIVTPICAHSLQTKSMVLGRDRLVSVTLCKHSRKTAYLSVDGGNAFKLRGGDAVEVTRSKHRTRLVRLSGKSFYEIVNQKLGRA